MNGKEFGKVDLHIHTIFSDGTDTPEEVLAQAKEAGLALFSVTDHDEVKACRILSELRKPEDPGFLSGVEFSCRDEEGQYHILGYGYDPDAESVMEIVARGHEFRMKKLRARLEFLADEFGIRFSEQDMEALFDLNNPGKPHIGNLMVRYGYTGTKEEAITRYIDRIRFRIEYIRPEEAIRAVLSGGGIPVLAHPSLGRGDQVVAGDALDKRVRRLTGYGLQGLEAFYSGFSEEQRKEVLAAADRYGLYVTAGSDCHGTNKKIRIGETGLDGAGEIPEGFIRFLTDLRLKQIG